MFSEVFGFAYFVQRHEDLVQAVERERLIGCLRQAQRAERAQLQWGKRVLAATGQRLVTVGTKLQQSAAH